MKKKFKGKRFSVPILLLLFFISLGWGTAFSQELRVEVLKVYWRNAADLADTLSRAASEWGRIVVDERTNSLIVRDYSENIAAMKELLKKHDVQPKQVRITVGFVDRKRVKEQGISIGWFFEGQRWSVGNLSNGTAVGPGSTSLTMEVQKRMERLETANRQVLLLNEGVTGSIFVGRELENPEYFISYGFEHGHIRSLTGFRRVGASFLVIPRIIGDDRMELEITPIISRFSLDSEEVEEIRLSSASTTVAVKNGETVVIGGNENKEGNFGRRFLTQRVSSKKTTYLLMTVTATIE